LPQEFSHNVCILALRPLFYFATMIRFSVWIAPQQVQVTRFFTIGTLSATSHVTRPTRSTECGVSRPQNSQARYSILV
jgi:hypothetical protein